MLTADERRIIEYVFMTDPVELRDLPDWLLGRLRCAEDGTPTTELHLPAPPTETIQYSGEVCRLER